MNELEHQQTHSEERAVRRRWRRLRIIAFVGTFVMAFAATVFSVNLIHDNFAAPPQTVAVGATFSPVYAREIGVDWRAAYLATLDDLGVKKLRLAAYWPMVEPARGYHDWSDLDWQIDEAQKRGVQVLLAVGRKLPRWPECHVPDWAQPLPEADQRPLVLDLVRATVSRYADRPNIIAWQVENEPLFPFGVCPPADDEFLAKEIAEVRAMDSRPIVLTETGELSTWMKVSSMADVLGISTYRMVWNKYMGYFFWPIGPQVYRQKWLGVSSFLKGAIISELQAEPWSVAGITAMSRADMDAQMNPARLRDNFEFAQRIGFPDAYLWGVEWWYWSKVNGYPQMWEAGRDLIHRVNAETVPMPAIVPATTAVTY